MPYAVTKDDVRLYFEEAGSGTPIIFLHEFAADHTNWEPQMRYFARGHRCIAYSARGYTPSDVPPSKEAYSYQHFYTDALAVLDHLKIAKAHFIGLSMGSYSSLQVGLHAPERALVDDAGRRRLGIRPCQSRWLPPAMPGQCRTIRNASARRKSPRSRARRPAGFRSSSRTRAAMRISTRRWREHDSKGSANTMRSFQGGRPSIYTLTEAIRKVPTPALIICGDEDDAVRRAQPVPEEAPSRRRADDVFRSRAMCSISKSPRCSMKWSSASSRWSKPGAGRHATRARWWRKLRKSSSAWAPGFPSALEGAFVLANLGRIMSREREDTSQRHSGAREARTPMCNCTSENLRFRVWSFGPSRNDGFGERLYFSHHCTRSPCAKGSVHTSHHRYSGTPGLPCATVYGLWRALPGDRAFLPPSSAWCDAQASSPT